MFRPFHSHCAQMPGVNQNLIVSLPRTISEQFLALIFDKKKYFALEGKRYKNNFQERDFLRDLKLPPFLCSYVAGKNGRDLQIT